MKTAEEILAEWTHTHPEIKKYVIKAMEAYASQQTEKYKELVEVMDKLYDVSADTLYELEIDPTEEMGKLYIKIQLLKTELGL